MAKRQGEVLSGESPGWSFFFHLQLLLLTHPHWWKPVFETLIGGNLGGAVSDWQGPAWLHISIDESMQSTDFDQWESWKSWPANYLKPSHCLYIDKSFPYCIQERHAAKGRAQTQNTLLMLLSLQEGDEHKADNLRTGII